VVNFVFEGPHYDELMMLGGLHEKQTVRWVSGQQEMMGDFDRGDGWVRIKYKDPVRTAQ
jgi:hypothetical protein